ncbi:FecR family protein [Chitinophaga pinensis]|uniref:DUF4974 domain-containing protein n=1 Tax=Chitinophaga pinensis TaxID=79329 RepID=A0A5C6LN26_9BACT|nr:FecR domain-containing protein [Chitinophaga pinensis]TWV98874.1 DUF4974 domain-containing protein [Chitinophaga pinensis]
MTKEQLTDLTAKYLKGTATPEEHALLEKWYYSFNQQELSIALPGEEEAALEARMKRQIDQRIKAVSRRSLMKRLSVWQIAAGALLLLTGGLLILFSSNRQVYRASQHPQQIVLKDGSKVWLNAETRLVYTDLPFFSERKLDLTGEAYFDVASDPEKPFIIQSGDMTTQVLGTAFNIKAYPDEPFYITVTSGKVRLEDKQTKTVTVLTSNKQLKYASQHPPVLKEVASATAHAWTSGQLEFYDQSFGEIARAINRKYNVKVVFANNTLEQCMITASFEKESAVSRVIDLLCKINNATYTFSADSSIVTLEGKGCQ